MNVYENEIIIYGSGDQNQQAQKSQKPKQQDIPNIQQSQQIKKQITQQIHPPENNIIYGDHDNLKRQYYKFFKEIINDAQNYVPQMSTEDEFKKHKIKYLKGNQFHQNLHSYGQVYIRVKNTQKQGTIVIYTVIIAVFQLEITLLNIDEDAKQQYNKIGSGTYGSVRVQSQNNRMFAVKRQRFKEKDHLKEFNMMANQYEINEAIKELAIYKICSLLKIGPAVETQIGFDLICYRDCIQFQIQYCLKIGDQKQGIYVDENRFEKQIKQCLLILHFYQIIHKDIKPANILFSITYNKYVLTDFGISHPVNEKIGYRSQTHRQGTMLFMSKQMLQIGKGKTGLVHLYGNDKHSLFTVLNKQMNHKNIEEGMKQFNQKMIKQQNTKYEYEYEYLKLKYYCIKPDSKMEEVQNYWKYMNTNRKQQLIAIVDKSIEYHKIKSVYTYLSKFKDFKECNLESLRMQSQSIKNIKIDPDNKQVTEFKLKNALRSYGYGQQVKDIIIKLKLEQKYKDTLKIINKILNQRRQVNHRDRMYGNHVNYIKNIKNQIFECQQKKDYRGMFKKFMIILQYGNLQEQLQTIQKLKKLNYQRKKDENIVQMISVCKIEQRNQKLKQFKQFMKLKDQEMDKIIREWDLDSQVAEIYSDIGEYKNALQYYTKSFNLIILFSGEEHPSVAVTYNNIANVYKSMGKYDKALEYYTKSVNMQISFYGQQHPSVADTYNNIATVYQNIGKYEKALEYYTNSVNMKISFYGEQHPSVADTYNNIATVYQNIGKYEKALEYYTNSVNMKISFYGEQHPSVADTYNNIANIYDSIGKYEKALEYYTKSINMKISFYGEQHPSVADTYNNIAGVYQNIGKYEKALEYYTNSVNMQISFYGEQHPSIADTYNNIGVVYDTMGKYDKALEYYTKSVNMKISFYGQQHPSVADTYNNIANIYDSIGKYKKALKYLNKSISMYISFYGQQHPSIAEISNNIGVAYYRIGKYEKALEYYTNSVNMKISFYGQQHLSIANTYNHISSNLFALTKLTQSLKYCNKSLKILSNLSITQYPQTAHCYHLFSSIFFRKEKYIKSLHYKYCALDTFIKFSHFDDNRSPTYLSLLADIYYKMNRFIPSYFFYRMSCQISVKYFPLHDKNVRKAKDMMNKMEWSMPSLIHNYTTNIQFMNGISNKYSKVPNYKLMKVLLGRKWQLKFEQQHRNRRGNFQYLKCVIEIYLCYKYLGQPRELKNAEDQMKQQLLRFEQSQQKSIFREFIYEISQ